MKYISLSQSYKTILSILSDQEQIQILHTTSKGATHLHTCSLTLLIQGSQKSMNQKISLT